MTLQSDNTDPEIRRRANELLSERSENAKKYWKSRFVFLVSLVCFSAVSYLAFLILQPNPAIGSWGAEGFVGPSEELAIYSNGQATLAGAACVWKATDGLIVISCPYDRFTAQSAFRVDSNNPQHGRLSGMSDRRLVRIH